MGRHKHVCAGWMTVLLLLLLVGCARKTVPSPPSHSASTDGKRGEGVAITGISFVDENDGWMVQNSMGHGSSLLRTRDGGLTWEKSASVPTAGRLYAVQALTQDSGWVATEDGLFRTNDGGETWEQVLVADLLKRFQFVDDRHGWMKPYGQDSLQTTRDGGRTWTSLDSPCKGAGGAFAFVDPKNGWMVCPTGGGAGIQEKELYRTEDGGATWRLLTKTGQQPGDMPLSSYTSDLFFLDTQHGWLGSAKGDLLTTRDGGKSWERLPGLGAGIEEIQFLSPQRGYVVLTEHFPYRSRLLFTSDGGKTWVERYASGQR